MPVKGYKQTEEHKKKIRDLLIGRVRPPLSEEWKRKLSQWQIGRKLTNAHKENIGKAGIGKIITIETRLKISEAMKGKTRKPFSQQARINMSLAHRGSKSYLWKGGLTSINETIRKSIEYKFWREAVYKRDNYTCVWCGQVGGRLNADHIKTFAKHPELRLVIDNGRTLCVLCHRKTDTYGR